MLTIRFNSKVVRDMVPRALVDQVPYIIATGINSTLFAALKDQAGERGIGGKMDNYIKGGATPWTKKGMRVGMAAKRDLAGGIHFLESRRYMAPLIWGGRVSPRKQKLVAPSRAVLAGKFPGIRLNKRGSLPGYSQKNSSLVARKKAMGKYFLGELRGKRPDGKASGPGSYGLWQRYGGKKNPSLRLALDLSKTDRQQKAVYPADRLLSEFIDENIEHYTALAMQHAFRTIK